MRKASVLYKDQKAGILTQQDDGYFIFKYDQYWYRDANLPAISLTLPKTQQEFHSEHLFPFFYNMLPEGSNKQMVCKLNRIDSDDDFGLLLMTANTDNIGAIKVRKLDEENEY